MDILSLLSSYEELWAIMTANLEPRDVGALRSCSRLLGSVLPLDVSAICQYTICNRHRICMYGVWSCNRLLHSLALKACNIGSQSVVEKMVELYDTTLRNTESGSLWSMCQSAVAGGHVKLLEWLIHHGYDTWSTSDTYRLACHNLRLDILCLLKERDDQGDANDEAILNNTDDRGCLDGHGYMLYSDGRRVMLYYPNNSYEYEGWLQYACASRFPNWTRAASQLYIQTSRPVHPSAELVKSVTDWIREEFIIPRDQGGWRWKSHRILEQEEKTQSAHEYVKRRRISRLGDSSTNPIIIL